MENISGYHAYLFLGKITGSLTEAEQKELQTLFAENSEAEAAFIAFLNRFPAEDVSTSFNYLNDSDFWDGHLPGEVRRLKRRENRIRILKRSGAVAAMVALLFFAWTFWYREIPGKVKENAIAKKPPATIQLTLANGQVIDLNERKGEIEDEDLILKNEDGSLSYRHNSNVINGVNSVQVPAGMDYKINLADGSKVWMNSKTKMDFPSKFAKDKREITISGEAYLEIAKDPAKPFIVKLQDATVQVTGTEFNVNTYEENETKVSLVNGSVNMTADNSTIHLKAGLEAIYTSDSKEITQRPFEIRSALSWRNGVLYYDSADLDDISKVLDRWYGIQTRVDNRGLLTKQFAGIINKNEPVDVFLDNLKAISRIESYFDREGVLHFK